MNITLLLFVGVHSATAQILSGSTEVPAPISNNRGSSATVDWNNISFSTLPALAEDGAIQVSPDEATQLGYDPSRQWRAGASPDSMTMLGDVQDSFGLEQFNLAQIERLSGQSMGNVPLDQFGLLRFQTLGSLVNAVPNLGQNLLQDVQPLSDLVAMKLDRQYMPNGNVSIAPSTLSEMLGRPLSQIATDPNLAELSLGSLPLSNYTVSAIPGLAQTPMSKFAGWQQGNVNGVPGLSQVPFSQFPNFTGSFFGFFAISDVTYGPKEHRTTPTKHSITGSDRVGFNYQCAQDRGCAYLELNSPLSLGAAGDPFSLHGAQWIKGGTSPGGQMVRGGYGVLGAVNGGMEPTGRLPFGDVFKIVLTNTNESEGSGTFAFFFRYCQHFPVDLGCTPYFIGPVPFYTVKEKGIVLVGLSQMAPPQGVERPPLPDEVQDIIGENGEGGDGTLCGDGPGGIDFKALADATGGIEGNYNSLGQWGCDRNGTCGRGLGRYQFMTYREDVKAAILSQPGGSAFYNRIASGARPSEAELAQYFGPEVQDRLFKNAQTQNIQTLQRRGLTGDNLIACLGQMWYSGECSHSNGRDFTNGPTVSQYGRMLVANYRRALQRNGATPCNNAASGPQGDGKATGRLTSPAPNAPITSEFGPRPKPCEGCSSFHQGIDFGVPDGTPIRAADGGRVVFSGRLGGYGNTMVVDHGNGVMTLYAHNSQLLYKVGDTVSQGQVITRSGHSGVGTGPHLHFGVYEGARNGDYRTGRAVNPRRYLRR